jgi:CheY-like chemotaxis protein
LVVFDGEDSRSPVPLFQQDRTGYSRRGDQLLKVLIAEDELLIADVIEETLIENGYEVCGIARTVNEAVALGEMHRPDLAVLDVRLANGDRGPDIARRLKSKGKFGVLYATGDGAQNGALTLADGEASISKPYRPKDLVRALVIVQEIVTAGTATPPFPPCFRLLRKSAVFAQASLP